MTMNRMLPALALCFSGLAWGAPQDETPVIVARSVELRLEENLGILKVQFKVKNPTDRPLEGDVRFSAPAGGAVYEASLLKHISSTERKAKVVGPDQAAAFYALQKSNAQEPTTEDALVGQALRGKYPH